MTCALMDLTVTAVTPWTASPILPATWDLPVITVDAAACRDGYRIGIYSPAWGGRTLVAPPDITNQQTSELYAIDAATRWAIRLGVTTFTLCGDNKGALHLVSSMRPLTPLL